MNGLQEDSRSNRDKSARLDGESIFFNIFKFQQKQLATHF